MHQFTGGIPRLINLLCDRALLTAYSSHANRVSAEAVAMAAGSLELERPKHRAFGWLRQRLAPFAAGLLLAGMIGGGAAAIWHYRQYATVLVELVASGQ